jgi:hypothetical protein
MSISTTTPREVKDSARPNPHVRERTDGAKPQALYLSVKCLRQLRKLSELLYDRPDRMTGWVIEQAVREAVQALRADRRPWPRGAGRVATRKTMLVLLSAECRQQVEALIGARPDGVEESKSSIVRKAVAGLFDREFSKAGGAGG